MAWVRLHFNSAQFQGTTIKQVHILLFFNVDEGERREEKGGRAKGEKRKKIREKNGREQWVGIQAGENDSAGLKAHSAKEAHN